MVLKFNMVLCLSLCCMLCNLHFQSLVCGIEVLHGLVSKFMLYAKK